MYWHAHLARPCLSGMSQSNEERRNPYRECLQHPCRRRRQQCCQAQHRCAMHTCYSICCTRDAELALLPVLVVSFIARHAHDCQSALTHSLQDFPIPEAKLIQLAQELFAKEAGVTDDTLLADDFRCAELMVPGVLGRVMCWRLLHQCNRRPCDSSCACSRTGLSSLSCHWTRR
jgi:hypothetical protein